MAEAFCMHFKSHITHFVRERGGDRIYVFIKTMIEDTVRMSVQSVDNRTKLSALNSDLIDLYKT